MTCLAKRARRHHRLARRLRYHDAVEHADYLDIEASPSPHPETELVVQVTRRGSVPAGVLYGIADAGLELADSQPANNPDYRRVVVR